MLDDSFFDRTTTTVARDLIGKVIRRRYRSRWLSALIIETEAYCRTERGSHASLGRTPSREALFMPPGTIYMYYSRGGDSLNVSTRGAGNAVLIKSAYPFFDRCSPRDTLALMQALNPKKAQVRPETELCSGQTLLCRALDLRVPDWTGRHFDRKRFHLEDAGPSPSAILQTTRLGIPAGRDEHLMYRFVHADYARWVTSNPRTKRDAVEGRTYRILEV